MIPIRKILFSALLLLLLSSLSLSESESFDQLDVGGKVRPGSILMTPCIINDFLVNDDTGSAEQSYPAIAADSSGNFTVSWQDYRNGNFDIYLQRYGSSSIPIGPNTRVNDDTGSRYQEFPAISTNNGGDLVLTWNDTRTYSWDIYFQRYSSNGALLDSNLRVNSTTFGWRWRPEVTIDKSGDFTITWNSDNGADYDIFAQRYNSSGNPLGTNFRVDDDTGTSWQLYPSIVSISTGGFVISWTDVRNGDPDIYAQRYDSTGTALGPNFKVNDDDGSSYVYQGMSAVCSDALGSFVIVWEDERNNKDDIYAQRYTSAGELIGSNFRVNDDTAKSGHWKPTIAVAPSGNVIIAWEDIRNGNYDIYAQRLNSAGNKIGTNFLVNNSQSSPYGQILPTVAATSSDIYFAWSDSRRGNWDIYAKIVGWTWGTPHIVLNPGILNFLAMQNGTLPPAQNFSISNKNGGSFSWTLSHNATWLNVSPDSGSGDSTAVTVNVNRTDSLPFASYDTIIVSSPDADNSPQMIPVNYYISPSPSGPDPGIPDTVSVERMENVPPNTHLPPVHVYLFNDEPIAAYTVPLAFPDSIYNYDIVCDSVSFAGTRTPPAFDMNPSIDNTRNAILIWAVVFAGQIDRGTGPIAKIYFTTGPNWKTEYSVPINALIWPGGPFSPPGVGLVCIDSSGQFAWTPVFKAGALEVREQEEVNVPSSFELWQNYPNPFNPITTIPFRAGSWEHVASSPIHTTLKIYNILGQLVRTLVDEEKTPGSYEVIWDGKDDSGKEVSSGVYFYQLKTNHYTATKKMVLLR